jgi:hypothetical protein
VICIYDVIEETRRNLEFENYIRNIVYTTDLKLFNIKADRDKTDLFSEAYWITVGVF